MSIERHRSTDHVTNLDRALAMLHRSQETNHALLREQRKLVRRMRFQFAGTLVIALVALVSVAMATSGQQAVTAASGQASQSNTEREALMAMLGDEERQRILEFESQVKWLSAYMKSSPDFDPGAAVALFLSQVASNMDAVPRMHSEMQVMNARMAAVPAMVAEMQAINAKMAVMTGAMDSTMGRAGRMFPWMPFSP